MSRTIAKDCSPPTPLSDERLAEIAKVLTASRPNWHCPHTPHAVEPLEQLVNAIFAHTAISD